MTNRSLRHKPARSPQRLADAVRLHQEGRLEEAARHYAAILKAQPRNFDGLRLLGILRYQQGRHAEALDKIQSALKLRPTDAEALANLALVLGELARPEAALANFDKALAIQPDHAEALNNRGNALRDLKRLDEALASYDRALAIRPDHVEALNNRGVVLQELQRPEEALASYDRALAIRPDHAEAFNNRGTVLRDLDRPAEALASYDRALAIRPAYARARYNRGMTALSVGDFPAGWADYEHRWDRPGAPRRKLVAPYPAWKGEDLRGKRIIVYEEQGLGDVIQFSRFLTRLASGGASVTFLVRASMHRLLRALTPAIRLADMPPAGEVFDFQCALMSVPSGLGTTLDTLPADIPYLVPEAPLVAGWRRRIGHRGSEDRHQLAGQSRGQASISAAHFRCAAIARSPPFPASA